MAVAEVERRVAEIMDAARRRDPDDLEGYHDFGPGYTKFDDFAPLERQDGETARRLEREAILGVAEFVPEVDDLHVNVIGIAAVATFVMRYLVVTADGEHMDLRARVTLVFARRDAGWLIVHEHISPFVENS